MYPDQFRFRISETELSQKFCGRFRPGHFEGMLTVVLKLLQIVGATHAYFGEKDFQQLELVRQMARAFFLETSIVPCPTEREESGLALSSRNTRLSESEQDYASQLAVELRKKQSVEECSDRLRTLGFDVEYVEDFNGHRLAAVQYKNVRLIDNVPLAISVFRGQVDSKEVSHDSRS
jgi:pantoate--beta-alanine ligase